MNNKLKLAALCGMAVPLCGHAQVKTADAQKDTRQDVSAFVFTESQLGEDDEMTQNVIMVGSNNNVYTSNVGYLWSPVRFKFRAYNSRYNDIYMNGVRVNNAENGQFNYSTIGGMNDAVRGVENSNPFEYNSFAFPGMGGCSVYNMRASNHAAGSKLTLSGTNRNYTLRGMYSFGTGVTQNGWAFFGTVGYRWANMNTAAVEGTFYNSLSYFLSAQKIFNDRHSLNLATWGNPTERAQQGASTDEAYWLANDRLYNPYWGYQDGKKRSSRVVNNYEPSALLTWDFKINPSMKLTTSAYFKYAMYSSTKLNYNGTNPAPDYWKNFPSYHYDVWGDTDGSNNDEDAFWTSYYRWTSGKAARQIDFDALYFANNQLNKSQTDAKYYIQAKHNDHLTTNLSSTYNWNISAESRLTAGLQLASNKGMHYQTMEDLLGGEYFHNVNTYAIGTYPASDPRVQYDLNRPNAAVRVGDRFGYDYNILLQRFNAFAVYSRDKGISHNFLAAQLGGEQMWREGNMRNGLCADYSYGKSGKARFLDGGFKMGSTLNLGHGNALTFGVGYETSAPQASTAFVSPEMNNNFVDHLKNEKRATAELGYMLNCNWLQLNLNAYYSHTYDGTEWQNYYDDNENSFTYVSMTGVQKDYYGVELGARFKVTSNLDINLIGTCSDAKYVEDTQVSYMLSTLGTMQTTKCFNKNMRESGTPLTALSLGVDYRIRGWYLNLTGNYYDRIYLSYTPVTRFESTQQLWAKNNYGGATVDNATGEYIYAVPSQAKGKGGFMLDASIGHQFRVANRPLSVNLTLTNITNNTKLVTGGYEQSRMNYSVSGETLSDRTYNFTRNPKKFYALGINGMINLNYRF